MSSQQTTADGYNRRSVTEPGARRGSILQTIPTPRANFHTIPEVQQTLCGTSRKRNAAPGVEPTPLNPARTSGIAAPPLPAIQIKELHCHLTQVHQLSHPLFNSEPLLRRPNQDPWAHYQSISHIPCGQPQAPVGALAWMQQQIGQQTSQGNCQQTAQTCSNRTVRWTTSSLPSPTLKFNDDPWLAPIESNPQSSQRPAPLTYQRGCRQAHASAWGLAATDPPRKTFFPHLLAFFDGLGALLLLCARGGAAVVARMRRSAVAEILWQVPPRSDQPNAQ